MSIRIESQAEPISGYKLIKRLGAGGFGEVWKVEAPGGVLKAIKFVFGCLDHLYPEESSPVEQELQALQRIQSIRHPYLLSLDRYDIVEDRLLIIMELADCNLWEHFQECRARGLAGIPREELLRYLEETAEVLDLMNIEHQLQHSDIKPQNLFLVHNHVKVGDFGLVKDLEGMIPSVIGGVTPVYAAPETFDDKVSRFSDQYSLAVVYQELLTGQRPFRGNFAPQILMQHLTCQPDLSSLPPSDRSVIARALSKRPDHRYPTCVDLVRALRDADANRPNLADHTAAMSLQPCLEELSPAATETVKPPAMTLGKQLRKKTTPVLDRTVRTILQTKVISINELPMLPEAAIKAMLVARDPSSSIRDFAVLLEQDPSLATGILKLGNSPLYRVGRTVTSVRQAVVRLGMRECQNLILAMGQRRLFRNVLVSKRWRCEELWRHSLITACVCRHLNRTLKLGYSGEEFACGICHDIGRLLITLGAPSHCELADPLDFQEDDDTLRGEQEVLGGDHCTFGAWFGKINGLPDPVIQVIQHHHAPHSAPEHQGLVHLVAVADHMANYLQRELRPDGYELPAHFASDLALDPEKAQTLADAAVTILSDVSAEVEKIIGPHGGSSPSGVILRPAP